MPKKNSEKNKDPQNPVFSNSDKRYLPRWEVDNRIICKIAKEKSVLECRSIDISCAGACLILREDIPAKINVNLKIFLDDQTAFNVDGEIMWTRVSEFGTVVGVHFENATSQMQELILKYAFEISREDLHKHWFKGWNGIE